MTGLQIAISNSRSANVIRFIRKGANAMASLHSKFRTKPLLSVVFSFAAVLCALAFSAGTVLGQDYLSASGTPTFVAPQPLEQGFTDEANGNLHLEFSF